MQSTKTFVQMTFPTTGVNTANKEVKVTSHATVAETPKMTISVVANVGATWKKTTDVFTAITMVSHGT